MSGPLAGLRVVELASEHAAFAGKMLGDLGADVIVIEPPGGHPSRAYGPFADDVEASTTRTMNGPPGILATELDAAGVNWHYDSM